MSEVKIYRGPGVAVTFDARRCLHAGECVRGLPQVFNPETRPWIQADKASADQIAEVVARCPTGALKVQRDDSRQTPAPETNDATIVADGPVMISGQIEVCVGDGRVLATETRFALCRCGASKNKPFCDGSHSGIGFRDDGACSGEIGLESQGPLKLTVFENGPVQCDGPFAIKDAFGEVAYRGTQCWLCRCGASKNKPFCDGSHKEAGFTG